MQGEGGMVRGCGGGMWWREDRVRAWSQGMERGGMEGEGVRSRVWGREEAVMAHAQAIYEQRNTPHNKALYHTSHHTTPHSSVLYCTCMRCILPCSVRTSASSDALLQCRYARSKILKQICKALCCLEQIQENSKALSSGPLTECGSRVPRAESRSSSFCSVSCGWHSCVNACTATI
jgi:hypothetical protein